MLLMRNECEPFNLFNHYISLFDKAMLGADVAIIWEKAMRCAIVNFIIIYHETIFVIIAFL